ncbi:MAG: sulfite exporter TauE/SafE family protein [Bacteroidetes bacterium]|nr:sulfite exporter TauE/SafE family protein [Bacteroidota bacterium]
MEVLGYFASILIGISLGLIGSGGSILTVPVLVYLFHINPLMATTYSLCVVGASSIAGVISRVKQKLVDIKTIIVFGIPSVIGVFIARKFFLPNIPESIHLGNNIVSKSNFIMLFFASLMLISALSMILGKNKKEVEGVLPVYGLALMMVGLGEGMLTGIVGAGGGFLIIPALVLLGRLPMKKAIASSIFIISIKSIVGFVGDLSHTIIDWKFLITIVILATLGIIIGNYLNKKMDGAKLKKGFGWFVLGMACVIFIEQFFFAI